MKILLVSDSHSNNSALDQLALKYPHMDLYLHAGDSASYEWSIEPFSSVRGNCDYYGNFPEHMKLPIPKGFLWMQHKPIYDISKLKQEGVKLFISGHTHMRKLEVIDGITFVNPGAISSSRDGYELSYAIIEIKDEKIDVKFYQLDEK